MTTVGGDRGSPPVVTGPQGKCGQEMPYLLRRWYNRPWGGEVMAKAFDVAEYLLSKADATENDMTHMKLQKLLYYCQGFSLALLGHPLFPEVIEAWLHGPVVPVVYQAFKHCGKTPVESSGLGSVDALTSEEKGLIDDVYSVYGGYSAAKLRNLTHSETPWLGAEGKADNTITTESMRTFFPALLEETA